MTIIENLKARLADSSTWAKANWLAIIVVMTIIMMLFLCSVMFSWFIGFWANGLWGLKFDLGSCWTGISVVVAGIGSVAALAKTCWTVYEIDSQYNSELGCAPCHTGGVKNERDRL